MLVTFSCSLTKIIVFIKWTSVWLKEGGLESLSRVSEKYHYPFISLFPLLLEIHWRPSLYRPSSAIINIRTLQYRFNSRQWKIPNDNIAILVSIGVVDGTWTLISRFSSPRECYLLSNVSKILHYTYYTTLSGFSGQNNSYGFQGL